MSSSNNDIRHYADHHEYEHHHHHDLIHNTEEDSIDDLKCLPEIKEYDPKIRDLLDDLNCYSTKINQLEQCLQEENSKFHRVLAESSFRLNKIMKKCGERNITTSRPYYDALQKLNDFKIKCHSAALKYEKYNELYSDAKQAISEAESMFHKNVKDDQFDRIWQEKLNIANAKFTEAKLKRQEYETEHLNVMAQINLLEYTTSDLKSKNKNSIKKSKPYFDEAASIDSQLKKIKEKVRILEEESTKCKSLYSIALKNLEKISEEIHEKRAQFLTKSLKREPGVGAEIEQSCLSENLSKLQLSNNDGEQASSDCDEPIISSSLSSSS